MNSPHLKSAFLAVSLFLITVLAIEAADSGAGFGHAPPTPRQNSILSGVMAVTKQLVRQGRKPVVVFDLDHTIYEAGSRHKAIMLEFARQNRVRYSRMEQKVSRWIPDETPYEISGTFDSLGIKEPSERERAKRFWVDRFFSNDYVAHDKPIAGALAYVNRIKKAGAVIVYLTSRTDELMRPGSIESLRTWGYPAPPEHAILMMKPRAFKKSEDYRRGVNFKGTETIRQSIAAHGEVVALFDNEPDNVNSMARIFPDALTVFLDTKHSTKPIEVETGIPWIQNFRWSWLASPSKGQAGGSAQRLSRRSR